MIATTIEQSRHLLELGLDPKTADMFWKYSASLGNTDINGRITVSYQDHLFVGKYDGEIPAWSLSALLEVIPRDSALYKIENTYSMHHGWTTENHTNPIDAAYEIVCWLLEQGYIKKGGNNDENLHHSPRWKNHLD